MNNFVKKSGIRLNNVSAGNKSCVWGCDSSSNIYTLKSGKLVKSSVRGKLTQISAAADGTVLGVNKGNKIYHLVRNSRWVSIIGVLVQISVGSATQIWGTNKAGRVYYWNGKTWKATPNVQKFKMVACNRNGLVYAINTENYIFQWNSSSKSWNVSSGRLSYIEVDVFGNVYGTYRGKILRKICESAKFDDITNHFPVECRSFKSLSVFNKDCIWVVAKNGSVYSGRLIPIEQQRERERIMYFKKLKLANLSFSAGILDVQRSDDSVKASRLVSDMKLKLESLEKTIPKILSNDSIILNYFREKYKRLIELENGVQRMKLAKEKVNVAKEMNKVAREKSMLLKQKNHVELQKRKIEKEKHLVKKQKIKVEKEKDFIKDQKIKIKDEKMNINKEKLRVEKVKKEVKEMNEEVEKRSSLVEKGKQMEQKIIDLQVKLEKEKHKEVPMTTNKGSEFTQNFLEIALSFPQIPSSEFPDLLEGAKVGMGGTSCVVITEYKGEKVAVKILKPSQRLKSEGESRKALEESIMKEVVLAKLIKSPSMPYIVKTHGYVKVDNDFGIVMEYVDGGSLQDVIDEETKLDLSQVNRMIVQMLEAVSYLHQNNVLHSDIKPANFLVSQDKKMVKVCDFGHSRLKEASKEEEHITGTCGYQPVEACVSETGYGAPNRPWDVFSLGITIFELIMFEHPFYFAYDEEGINLANQTVYLGLMLDWKEVFPKIIKSLENKVHQKIFEMCCNFPEKRADINEVLKYAKENLGK